MQQLPSHPKQHRAYLISMALFIALIVQLSTSSSQASPLQPQSIDYPPPDESGGGSADDLIPREDFTEQQLQEIQTILDQNEATLTQEGMLQEVQAVTPAIFSWPLRLKPGLSDYGYYGISNFVDHNASYPNFLLDYNSGKRTYDLANGYNHAGTDIFLWPFAWRKMTTNAVEVIAAASGTIIYKADGNYDRNCDFSNPNWNAIYVRHTDGSVAWYGHLKKGSLTSKVVGNKVVAGEYLGVVGSSGSSTGPHLHFEVHDSSGKLIDPYLGPSNPSTSFSLWKKQFPYYDSAINHLATASAAPVFPPCPNVETSAEQASFNPGSKIYFTSYYRDQRSGQVSQYRIYRPNGALYTTWTYTKPMPDYAASYAYWSFTMPIAEQRGYWRYEVSYMGKTYTHSFYYGYPKRVALPITRK